MKLAIVKRETVLSAVELAEEINNDDQEITLEEASAIDTLVWVGNAQEVGDPTDDPNEFQVIGDQSGFVYFIGSQEECNDIAKQMNAVMPFSEGEEKEEAASIIEAAMRTYKPRRKRGKRTQRITPQEKLERKRIRLKNRFKNARKRKAYYRKNKGQLIRRAKLRKRINRPETNVDPNWKYSYS